MRRNLTGPERMLWHALRAGRFAGAKFRRQVVIGSYIADFACRSPAMVVIEADGDSHAGRERYDAARTAELEMRGYKVMRFTNEEVAANLDGVLMASGGALDGLPLSPPSPLKGRGSNAPLPALSPEGERTKGW
jgi:very-short-patch-repair endonuclease